MATRAAGPETAIHDDAPPLSAAARESFGFADDQFMELSTSGASIYSLAVLPQPSLNSSGRLVQSSAGSSSDSLRRALLGTPARATQDELSLSCSGMSLASLGSLSRSVRRLSTNGNLDEVQDDPVAWRESSLAGNQPEDEGSGQSHQTRDVTQATSPRSSDQQIHVHDEEGRGSGREQHNVEVVKESRTVVVSGTPAPLDGGGRVQELSGPIAQLRRQQSYTRRWPAMLAARNQGSQRTLPASVDHVPAQSFPISEQVMTPLCDAPPSGKVLVSTSAGSHHVPSTQVPVGATWGGVLQGAVFGPVVGDDCEAGGRANSRGGNSSGNVSYESGPSPRGKSCRKSRRPMRKLLRTMARLGPGKQQEQTARQVMGSDAVSAEGEWSSVTSCSADSSLRGGTQSVSPAGAQGHSPSTSLQGGGRAIRTRSAPQTAEAAAAAGPVSDTEIASKVNGGFRGRITQALAHRRKGSKKITKDKDLSTSEKISTAPSLIDCMPHGIFNPEDLMATAPKPGIIPEWNRSRSAPVGPTDSNHIFDGLQELMAKAFPGTPLGTSNRSFDPNGAFSPSTYDADASNPSLPPRLGSKAATECLGASFDPNMSVRSLFDASTSGEAQSREQEKHGNAWAHVHREVPQHTEEQHGALGPLATVIDVLPDERPHVSAAMRLPVGVETGTGATLVAAPGESSTVAVTQRQAEATSFTLAAVDAAVLLEDQLAHELSDLSVSAERRRDDERSETDHASEGNLSTGAQANAGVHPHKVPDVPTPVDLLLASHSPTVQQHQHSPWLNSGGVLRTAASPGMEVPPHASVSVEHPKGVGNGAWHLSPQPPTSGTDQGAQQLASNPPWSIRQELPVLAPLEIPSVGILSSGADADALMELGPAPSSAPLSGTIGRVQSADVNLVRRKLAGTGGRNWGGMAQNASWRHKLAPRHTSLELGKATQSTVVPATESLVEFLRPLSTERSQHLTPIASVLSSLGASNNTASNTSTNAVNGFWGTGAQFGEIPRQSPPTLPHTSSAPTPQSSVSAGGVGAPRNELLVPGPHGTRQATGHWWSSGSCPPRLTTDATQETIGVDESILNRRKSAPGVQTTDILEPSISLQTAMLAGAGRGEAMQDDSWSTLEAMIPMPGLCANKNMHRGETATGVSSGGSDRGVATFVGGVEQTDTAGGNNNAGRLGGSDEGGDVMDSSNSSGWARFPALTRRKSRKTLEFDQQQENPEQVSKRSLHSSRVLDVFAKSKKQCVDGAPPVPIAEKSHANVTEAFVLLRDKLAVSTAEPSTPNTSTGSGRTSSAMDTSKANRQAVAARRPRMRGRFMKSQQKWVTQGELKQEKRNKGAAATAGSGGTAIVPGSEGDRRIPTATAGTGMRIVGSGSVGDGTKLPAT